MEILYLILSLFFLILSIIMIVKFFQIAHNVQEITRILSMQKKDQVYIPTIDENEKSEEIGVESHVIELKTKKQMKVLQVINDSKGPKFICSENNGITSQSYRRDEIELFNVYYAKE